MPICKIHRGQRWHSSRPELSAPSRSQTHLASLLVLSVIAFVAVCIAPASAQTPASSLPKVHYFLDANQGPGVVAGAQVARGKAGVGTFQALAIRGPAGVKVGLAQAGQFLPQLDAPVTTGMLVGAVYRVRVTNIPFHPGQELYPTIEVIDRIAAPPGREHRFPIPVVLTQDDLRLALQGALVTRVIYLEDNELAEPTPTTPDTQTVFDVSASDNALQVADQLGRPVAILRIGSRVPMDLTADLTDFLYGCPPWVPLITTPERQALVESGQWPAGPEAQPAAEPFAETPSEDVPRVPAW